MKKYLSILFLLIPILTLAGGQPDWELDQRTDNRWKRVAIETTDEGEFLRGGNVLCTDAALVVQTVGANNRCFEEVGSPDLMGRVEPGSQNLIHYSHELGEVASSGWWSDSNLTSVTANGMLGPFGTTTADGLIGSGLNDAHGIQKGLIPGVTQNVKSTITVYAKSGDKDWVELIISFADGGDVSLGDNGRYYFNVNTGVIGTKVENGNTTIHDYLVEEKANGFYRIGMIVSNSDATTAKMTAFYRTANADNDEDFSGNGSTVNTWFEGADLQIRDTFDSPVVTSGSTASRIGEGGNPHYDIPLQGGTRVQLYTDGSETDPNSKLTIDGNQILVTALDRDEDAYLTFDQGVDAIGDFIGGDAHKVDINITALTDSSDSYLIFWGVAATSDDFRDIDDLNGDGIWLRAISTSSNTYSIQVISLDGGNLSTVFSTTSVGVDTERFLSIQRDDTTITLDTFSTSALRDAGGNGDFDSQSGTVVNTPFQYVYGVGSYNAGSTGLDISGTIRNLDIGTHSEIFETKTGQELVSDGAFANIDLAAAKVITGITQATPGVVTLASGHGYVNGQVIFIEALDEMVELNNEYWKIRNLSGDTCELSDAAIGTWDTSSLDTSGFAAETTGGTGKLVGFEKWDDNNGGWHPGVDGSGALTGTADCDGEQTGESNLGQPTAAIENETYVLVFILSNHEAGGVQVILASEFFPITSADGTYTYYGDAGSGSFLNIRASASFISSIDDVSAREILNSGGVPEWTLATHIRPGYNEEDVDTDGAFISLADQVASALYHDVSGNGIAAHDGTSEATYALAFDKEKTYLMATQAKLNSNVYQFRVCADDGAGGDVACGSWVDYDGKMDVSGDELQFGYGLQGPFHSQWTMIDTRAWALHELRAYH